MNAEIAETGTMPTQEMKEAFEVFIAKFKDQSVGYRDTFYHGFIAGNNQNRIKKDDDI
jgi:hypothetical protein